MSDQAEQRRAAAASDLVAAIGPGAAQPDAQLPQEVRQGPPVTRKRPPTRKLKPGDLICGDCGEGNVETRKFCSRCGFSLAEAVTVKRPWWKRWLPARGAKVRKVGDRPKNRRGRSKGREALATAFRAVRRVVSLLLVVAGVVYGLYAPFRVWVNERVVAAKQGVERLVLPQYDPVSPVEVRATSELPEHPGAMAADGFSNTYWSAPLAGPEPTLVLRFDRAVTLSRAIVRGGANDDFQGLHRPQRLHLVFSTGKTADVDLKDNPDPQEVEIANGEGASSVEVHVVSVFRSVKGSDVALTELELFERS